MEQHPDAGRQAVAPQAPGWRELWTRPQAWVPAFAVAVVAATAVVAAFMTGRPVPASTEAALPALAGSSEPARAVVHAPPLKASTDGRVSPPTAQASAATRSMGAIAACRDCGVVEMVVAVHGYGETRASAYQMHIRMDDGKTRMVEQRGALAAGSRVQVQGNSVRSLPAAPGSP